MTHCGFIAILGASNVGKSTLVNTLVGQKVSIVSPKVQTTRSRILGIAIHNHAQLILIDTPGIFHARKKLDQAMVQEAYEAGSQADVHMIMVDVHKPQFQLIERLCKDHPKGVIVVFNKIDLIPKEKLLYLTQRLHHFPNIERIFMISALYNDGVEDLVHYLAHKVPKGVWLFPEDQITNIPQRSWAAEVTREQIFLNLHQELPYGIYVEAENWETFDNGSIKISQVIVVNKENYKGMVLGKRGQMLKKIGESARLQLEDQLGQRIHLKLFVKVIENWQEKSWATRVFGIDNTV